MNDDVPFIAVFVLNGFQTGWDKFVAASITNGCPDITVISNPNCPNLIPKLLARGCNC